ncbi:MAG: hypothetical protein R3C68_01220 [Myxococcota bacterium]
MSLRTVSIRMCALRKSDELQDFFTIFDEAVAALRERDVDTLARLDRALLDAKDVLESAPASAYEKMAEAVNVERRRLQNAIER